jgi:hypothetical protein
MANKKILWGMLITALTLELVLIGCPTETGNTGSTNNTGNNGETASISYTSTTDDGKKIDLIITKPSEPRVIVILPIGSTYVLKIDGVVVSKGTVITGEDGLVRFTSEKGYIFVAEIGDDTIAIFDTVTLDNGNNVILPGFSQGNSPLNGTWVLTQNGMYVEYKFNNGNIEVSMNNAPFEKGTYATIGNKLTIYISYIYGQKNDLIDMMGIELQAKWYTLAEFYNAYRIRLSDEEWATIEPMIQQIIQNGAVYNYSISGNTLTLTLDMSQFKETGGGESTTVTLTKK